MTLFILSMIIFTAAIVTMMIFLGLWTYNDAKVKSDQEPGIWVLAVLLIPNMLGLIVYLLVGRTKKDVPAPGKYLKPLIASAIVFAITIVMVVATSLIFALGDFDFGSNATMNSGVWSVRSTSLRNDTWTETVRSGRGTSRRTLTLNDAQMRNFHIESVNEEGGLFLLLEQNDTQHRIDISYDFYGGINLHHHGFTPGRIRMTLEYERVRNSHTIIRWQVP